jgi:DNA-binding transcriptional MocR family regulator
LHIDEGRGYVELSGRSHFFEPFSELVEAVERKVNEITPSSGSEKNSSTSQSTVSDICAASLEPSGTERLFSPVSARVAREINGGFGKSWGRIAALGRAPGALNFGQGFPDFSGSAAARNAAHIALSDGPDKLGSAIQTKDADGTPAVAGDDAAAAEHRNALNQYSPIAGQPPLLEALANFYHATQPRCDRVLFS